MCSSRGVAVSLVHWHFNSRRFSMTWRKFTSKGTACAYVCTYIQRVVQDVLHPPVGASMVQGVRREMHRLGHVDALANVGLYCLPSETCIMPASTLVQIM